MSYQIGRLFPAQLKDLHHLEQKWQQETGQPWALVAYQKTEASQEGGRK